MWIALESVYVEMKILQNLTKRILSYKYRSSRQRIDVTRLQVTPALNWHPTAKTEKLQSDSILPLWGSKMSPSNRKMTALLPKDEIPEADSTMCETIAIRVVAGLLRDSQHPTNTCWRSSIWPPMDGAVSCRSRWLRETTSCGRPTTWQCCHLAPINWRIYRCYVFRVLVASTRAVRQWWAETITSSQFLRWRTRITSVC